MLPTTITKAAAARILNADRVEALRPMKNGCIQVTYWINGGRCSSFVSRKSFERDAIEFREVGAVGLQVFPALDGGFSVVSATGGDRWYTVDEKITSCTCADFKYRGQSCKHISAVKNWMSTHTFTAAVLSDNPETWQPAPRKRPLTFAGKSIE